MLVRRLSEAAVKDWHRLRSHILMAAGELGSRHMTVILIDVPPGTSQSVHSDEEAEIVYVGVRGTGALSVAGDTQPGVVGYGAIIPPATDHSIANEGTEDFSVLSVQSPAISVDEVYGRQLADVGAGYDEDQDL